MRIIFTVVFHWAFQRFTWLIAIILVLSVGYLVQRELPLFRQFNEDEAALDLLHQKQGGVISLAQTVEARTHEAAKELPLMSASALNERLVSLDGQILAAKAELRDASKLPNLMNPAQAIIESAGLRVRISALEQERHFIGKLLPAVEKLLSFKDQGEEAVRAQPEARRKHVELYALWEKKNAEYQSLPPTQGFWRAISNEYVDPEKVRRELDQLRTAVVEAASTAASIDAQVARLQQLRNDVNVVSAFQYDRSVADAVNNELIAEIAAREERLKNYWLQWIITPLKAVLPTALMLLASIILLPLVLRPLLYYVGVPLASRRPPICLVPESTGRVDTQVGDEGSLRSGISQTVILNKGMELLVQPHYLQSVPEACSSGTCAVLRGSYLLTSIAAGLFNLTRVTSDVPQSVVLSAGRDSLTELALLYVPDGSAMVFHPRSLVGVVQEAERPVRITSHWRVLSLHAWMTLQFRYLVFHGPVTLIAKGARGVRIEYVGMGRDVDQDCTLGFTANLGYSTHRSQTFGAYLTGKKHLLKDRFTGDFGYVLYEEMPSRGSRSGSGARGIEGVLDAALKVLGI
ncbi:hypothetical protein IAI53_08760 [Thauera sp. CAU 1555]|uniref:Uncharacterized protein n=1 Tax=Thauera sedimentorum TaxID=2767595 RepID=A0ABR9BBU5_9RHOO|nr:hypothetical protein [Thauera sedimentorum]MBC9072051.1 hypothetical protein [Thauera sedimentorum]MBD8502970.1 hypothetical protein [Thauera sedimentorum]